MAKSGNETTTLSPAALPGKPYSFIAKTEATILGTIDVSISDRPAYNLSISDEPAFNLSIADDS